MANIFVSVLGVSLSASFLIAALMLLSPFLNRRYASKWKYWIWVFVAFRLLLPFDGDSAVTLLTQFRTSPELGFEKTGMDGRTGQMPQQQGQIVVKIPAQLTEPVSVPFPQSSFDVTPLDIAAFVWLLGCLAFLSVHLISYLHYKRQLLKRGTGIRDAGILRLIEELKQELRIKGPVRAVLFPEAPSPMMTGFLKPVLVLPEERYTSEELYYILKHELVHCKRMDVFAKLLFAAANVVHWFNPLIWMMQKEAAVDMELSCDERVTQGAGYAARVAYTETLLATLHRRAVKGSAFSTQFYGGTDIMKKRFRNILDKRARKNGAVVFAGTVLLTISLGTVIGCSVVRAGAEDVPDRAETERMPADGQFYGYLSGFDGTSATIDRQLWVTSKDEDWKPEYNEAAGFEVVDAGGEDIIFPFSEECTYSVLENHHNPVVELGKKEFERYLEEMTFPVLWIFRLQDGQIIDIREQYIP